MPPDLPPDPPPSGQPGARADVFARLAGSAAAPPAPTRPRPPADSVFVLRPREPGRGPAQVDDAGRRRSPMAMTGRRARLGNAEGDDSVDAPAGLASPPASGSQTAPSSQWWRLGSGWPGPSDGVVRAHGVGRGLPGEGGAPESPAELLGGARGLGAGPATAGDARDEERARGTRAEPRLPATAGGSGRSGGPVGAGPVGSTRGAGRAAADVDEGPGRSEPDRGVPAALPAARDGERLRPVVAPAPGRPVAAPVRLDVVIERIDVRVDAPATARRTEPERRQPALGLADYLARRDRQ